MTFEVPTKHFHPQTTIMSASVSIIIATTCTSARTVTLWRAIQSVLEQDWGDVEILVVVNGSQFDRAVFDTMSTTPRLRVIYQLEPSLHLALLRGRAEVSTPFFGFLDDDDEYLPGAIRSRISPMLADPTIDVVVSNGFRTSDGVDQPILKDVAAANQDPLRALLTVNWLASCGGLFRATTVGREYFEGLTKYFEWTKVALRIACDKRKIVLLEKPAYRYNVTPGSMSAISQTIEYRAALVNFIVSTLSLPLPPYMHRGMQERLCNAHHALAEAYVAEGQLSQARYHHFQSLGLPGGLKYLAYSRKLIFPVEQ